jgi:Zn-dependent M32 family carboxypeptidase
MRIVRIWIKLREDLIFKLPRYKKVTHKAWKEIHEKNQNQIITSNTHNLQKILKVQKTEISAFKKSKVPKDKVIKTQIEWV